MKKLDLDIPTGWMAVLGGLGSGGAIGVFTNESYLRLMREHPFLVIAPLLILSIIGAAGARISRNNDSYKID